MSKIARMAQRAPVTTPSQRGPVTDTPPALTLRGPKPATQADHDAQIAAVVADPIVSSALITAKYAAPVVGAADLTASVDVLREKVARVHAGDLSDAEAMLVAHMGTLNAMFCELARRAALNLTAYPEAADRYLRQALKTQGQCRATIETLAVLKSPPAVFARQANIANGPQQVNNGVAVLASVSVAPLPEVLPQLEGGGE